MFFQRLPFTAGFIGSMAGTIYVSMVLHSYVLSVLFSVLQVCKLPFAHSASYLLCVICLWLLHVFCLIL